MIFSKTFIKESVQNFDSVTHFAGDKYEFIKNYQIGTKTKKIMVVVSDWLGVEGRIVTAYPSG